ncbi:hypothetical protein [Beijerinckia mobilis]|uniref:hypothetical protein n=1 Tax=Beijerinckia mobilis TaxID=231434 RepID=UPI00054E1D1C|nr:hypothetical protein [Beijerinckia mobilis]
MSDLESDYRQDWIGKTSAGVLLGFGLAITLAGFIAWVGPQGPDAINKYQFVLWIVPPIWLGTAAACYFFSSGLKAWLWLGSANLLAYGMMVLARSLFH